MTHALLMHDADNVLLAVADLPPGTHVAAGDGEIVATREEIPSGHKLARRDVAAGELIVKYGQPIGRATANIAPGEHVHVHNVESLRGRGDLAGHSDLAGHNTDPATISARGPATNPHLSGHAAATDASPTSFMGYRRKDGRVGVRNHLLILSAVQCANGVVRRIAQLVPEVVPVTHVYGCGQLGDDHRQTQRVLEEFAQHPNVGAVLLVGLGCETLPTTAIGERLRDGGTLIRRLTIQEQGGSKSTVERGVAVARELLAETGRARREAVPLSELVVGLECGGSDAWSGITANPATGAASDLVVRAGGTVILSEAPEAIGAEHLLEARTTPEIAKQIWAATAAWEAEARRMGVDMRGAQPTPGNIAGGLTTIEEKSLGAISKGGSTPVRELIGYAHRPTQRGLVIMDTAGQDAESVTGMVAGGAQVVVFTTGRGSPIGCPIAPVVKVASNSAMYDRLADDMDVNAGTIVAEGERVAEVGRRIFDWIVAAANGEQTAAETWGLGEFAISILGRRM